MAKFIQDIHDLFGLLAGKNIATQQPPERIDKVLHEVIIGIFNDHYDHYVKNQKISDFLLPFKRQKLMTLTAGKDNLPTDYGHLRSVTLENGTKVSVIEDKFWPYRATRKVSPPSATDPICRIENQEADPFTAKIEVLPANTAKVVFYYFKTPRKAVYAYTKVVNRYVYDDANSVDVEFGYLLFPQIALKVLSRFGINLREQQLINYAEQMKTQEDRK